MCALWVHFPVLLIYNNNNNTRTMKTTDMELPPPPIPQGPARAATAHMPVTISL